MKPASPWWRPLARRAVRLLAPDARNSLAIALLLDGPDRPPRPVESFDERRVLVMAPHADDEVIGCGGAICVHVRHGADVRIVIATDGAQGSRRLHEPGLSDGERASLRDELVRQRRREAAQAAETLGAREPVFLDGPDGKLAPTASLVGRLCELLDGWRPDMVYLPFVMDQHHDHWQTNRLLAAALPHCGDWAASLQVRGYEVWAPLVANRLVDISAVAALKRAALRAYGSQLADRDYERAVTGLNHYRALHLPDTALREAEAFHQTSARGFLTLMKAIEGRRA